MNRLKSLALVGVYLLAIRAAGEDNALPESVLKTLSNANQLELLSLVPEPEKEKPKDHFHGYTVLGKTAVQDAATRKKVVDSLTRGMQGEINPAKCFEPRHGIRAVHDGKTLELVICFACKQFEVYDASGNKQKFLVNNTPEPTFDNVLKDAGISKAK